MYGPNFALLICSLLWSIMQLWIKFHQKHLCWINMIYFCLFICCLIYFIFKGSSKGSSQHISLYFIIKHICFVPVNVIQEHVQWRFKPWFLSPNPSLRSIYIRSLLHHPKHSPIWPPPPPSDTTEKSLNPRRPAVTAAARGGKHLSLMFHLCSINTVNWSSRNIYFSAYFFFPPTYKLSTFLLFHIVCLLREKTCQKMTDNAVFEHDQITEETSRNGMSGSNVIAMELIKKQRGATVSFHSIRYRVEQKSGPICRRTTVHKEILVDLKWVNITQTKRSNDWGSFTL